MSEPVLPPVERSVTVSWDQETAFRRFTSDFASWWPRRTHSIGGTRVARIVFETQVGGRIFEEHIDGRRFQWGRIVEWEPPRRVLFTFHPSCDASEAQDVEVRFVPDGSGTRLELVASNWENLGKRAKRARSAYDMGWGYVVNVFAGRRTAGMRVLDLAATLIGGADRLLRGGTIAAINRARGEIPSA